MSINLFWCYLSILMDYVLGDLQLKIGLVYIDNIPIFSLMLKQHLKDFNYIIEKLNAANLKVNVNKIFFAKK